MKIPDAVGIQQAEAIKLLEKHNFQVVLVEALDKNTVITEDIRVIRQRKRSDHLIELTISYF